MPAPVRTVPLSATEAGTRMPAPVRTVPLSATEAGTRMPAPIRTVPLSAIAAGMEAMGRMLRLGILIWQRQTPRNVKVRQQQRK
ncbi:hypothetical protein ROS9278_03873 [Roseomonas sp. CECT 9278]|nr:hypothetical protein ROS9278_03873 [Roseomonas sp. CECT 9278]